MRWMLLLPALATSAIAVDPAAAVSSPAELQPIKGGMFDLCGYKSGDGTVRIKLQFQSCGPFSEGLAPVRIDGLFGFIGPRGKVIIPTKFETVGPFLLGHAEVLVAGKAGIIDRRGRLVIPARFDRISPFTRDTFFATMQAYTISPAQIEAGLTGFFPEISQPAFNGGLYNIKRGWLTKDNLEFEKFDRAERGLVWARLRREDLWGLMRANGRWQVSPKYGYVASLNEGRAIVRARSPSGPNGAVDANGRPVVPTRYARLSGWRNGYSVVQNGAHEGLLKPDGTLLAGRYFDDVEPPEEKILPRARLGPSWYSLRPNGELIKDETDGSAVSCTNGFLFRQVGTGIQISHARRRKPIGVYDNTFFSKRDCGTTLSVKRGFKWGYILPDGTPIPSEPMFENTFYFGRDTAFVKLDGLWGIIDRTGRFVVKPQYADIQLQQRGLAKVEGLLSTYWIDELGREVPEPNEQPDPARHLRCPGGLEIFSKGDYWGMRKPDGAIVIPARYLALSCFVTGVSYTNGR